MDVPDEAVLDVDLLGEDGSEDEGEAPPSSGECLVLRYHFSYKVICI